MRRLIRWLHRRQRATKAEPLTTEQETAYWLAEATRRREVFDMPPDAPPSPTPAPEPPPAPPVDWSGYDIQAEASAIVANHIPRRVQQAVRETAREAVTGNTKPLRIFTVRYLPLMTGLDAEDVAEWHTTAQMMLRSVCVSMRPELRARLATVTAADASLTIYAPRAWVASVPLRPVIEQHLLAAVSSATGVQIRDLLRTTWEESDGPYLWNVSLWDSADWREVAV